VWQVTNPMDGLPVSFHGEFQWVHLRFFGTYDMASFVCWVDEIDSLLG
jgi:hypothetical protein